jgi:RNA polymerase sigma factor (sigma-70 family)
MGDIEYLARTYQKAHGYQYDLDDYIDAGYEALARCLAAYNPDRGASFRTYAKYRIRGQIQDMPTLYLGWRKGTCGRRGWAPKRAWQRYETRREARQSYDPRESIENALAFDAIENTMPPQIQRRFQMYRDGWTMKEIAQQEGCSESWVSLSLKPWLPHRVRNRDC